MLKCNYRLLRLNYCKVWVNSCQLFLSQKGIFFSEFNALNSIFLWHNTDISFHIFDFDKFFLHNIMYFKFSLLRTAQKRPTTFSLHKMDSK